MTLKYSWKTWARRIFFSLSKIQGSSNEADWKEIRNIQKEAIIHTAHNFPEEFINTRLGEDRSIKAVYLEDSILTTPIEEEQQYFYSSQRQNIIDPESGSSYFKIFDIVADGIWTEQLYGIQANMLWVYFVQSLILD